MEWARLIDKQQCGLSESGLVLPIVLVSLTIISLFAVTATLSIQQSRLEVSRLEQNTFGHFAGQSALRRVIAALAEPSDELDDRILGGEGPFRWEFDGRQIDLTIDGEGGKLDLASTDLEIISRYLQNLNLSSTELAAVEERLSTHRQAQTDALWPDLFDDLISGYLPLDELSSDLTGLNPTGGIDPVYASPRVLAAIPDHGRAYGARGAADVVP